MSSVLEDKSAGLLWQIILNNLHSLVGFDENWWNAIDTKTQEEIEWTMKKLIVRFFYGKEACN